MEARQLLNSARARRQAMAAMDAGDYDTAQSIIATWSDSSETLSKALSSLELELDSRELAELKRQLENRDDLFMARKKLSYSSLYRQRGRKPTPKQEKKK